MPSWITITARLPPHVWWIPVDGRYSTTRSSLTPRYLHPAFPTHSHMRHLPVQVVDRLHRTPTFTGLLPVLVTFSRSGPYVGCILLLDRRYPTLHIVIPRGLTPYPVDAFALPPQRCRDITPHGLCGTARPYDTHLHTWFPPFVGIWVLFHDTVQPLGCAYPPLRVYNGPLPTLLDARSPRFI